MCLHRKIAQLMVRMNPKLYQPHIRIGWSEVPVLYMKLKRALYGLLCAGLLFYRKLRKDLEAMGFNVNPYDPCVANCMVNGKQKTVIWHVDNLKISHIDEVENTLLIHEIARIYGQKLTCSRGRYMIAVWGKITRHEFFFYSILGQKMVIPIFPTDFRYEMT